MIGDVQWAREVARDLLAEESPRRWAHVQAVGAKAEALGPAYGEDAELLAAAAWLHDVGYSNRVQQTGFHPLDGARHLERLGGEHRLCSLVANHSGAVYEARLRGLAHQMRAFPDERSDVRDAVWCCDMTTSPEGSSVSFDQRLAEIRERYGADHTVPRGITAAAGEIRRAVKRVAERAGQAGIRLP